MKITFLGTGTSHGVPSIDCMLSGYLWCRKGVCRAALSDPRQQRTRSSILVEYNRMHVLIDVSSDFRTQALRESIPKIDAVLITHCHSDHISGIPDIRSYSAHQKEPIPFYGSHESMTVIRESFPYIFDPDAVFGGGIPRIMTHTVDGPFSLFKETVTALPVEHGGLAGAFGYRIGAMAYIPDLKSLRGQTLDLLGGLDVLVLNCLRETTTHSSHLTLEQSIGLAREIRPKKCRFIHMSHDIDYRTDTAMLDDWMAFSYDGMVEEIKS
jgi:phosphoribosyl 1,2-cyclic phosphate phosphodiesterase